MGKPNRASWPCAAYTIRESTKGNMLNPCLPRRRWQNLAILPSALSLLAADAGDGYVPLGAGNFQDGRKVATVFEDPR